MSIELDDQQRVLSEVSHDLANRFHRSYYFLELLGEALDPASEAGPSLLEGLRGTVEDIESMTRSALDFVRPLELRLLRVRLEDLTASLRQHVGLREVELTGDLGAGRSEVEVDPARISEALAFLCRTAIDGAESDSRVVVEVIGGDRVGLRVRRPASSGLPAGPSLPLALTARIARLHGGDLEIDDAGGSSLTLRLPVAARRS